MCQVCTPVPLLVYDLRGKGGQYLEVSEQVCGSMELQAQVSWLSGPLLFEVTGAQQRTLLLRRLCSISLLCQWLSEQPSCEQQQRCVQEVQRLPGPVFLCC